jgi:hypothetical protein
VDDERRSISPAAAPIDRAMADAIAPPMLEFAMSCMSIRSGNTRDNPASALGPSWPTKCASTLAVTAMRMTFTTTFGAARRRSVETIGPSRSSRVPRRSETGTVRTPDPYPSTSLFPSQFGHRVSLMFLHATSVSRSGQAVITRNRVGGFLLMLVKHLHASLCRAEEVTTRAPGRGA